MEVAVVPEGRRKCKECGGIFPKSGKRLFCVEKCRSRYHSREARRKNHTPTIPDNCLSSTRVSMYERCPAQYRFRYVDGHYEAPGAAMVLGSSFHSGIEVNYRQKIETEQNLPVDDVCDAFCTDFDERRHEGRWFSDEKPGYFREQGIGLMRCYQDEIAPYVYPEYAERDFVIEFENYDWIFTGRMDLLTRDNMLLETKTSSSRPSRPLKSHVLQSVAYNVGIRANDGKKPDVRIDYVVKNKTPVTVSHAVEVGNSQVDFFLNQIARVAHAIQSGIFHPNRGHIFCSHRFCGYAPMCEKEYGGIVPER